MDSLNETVKGVLSGLKDFQFNTVMHISNQFKTGKKRMLVADEVGLGKTLVARGCVAMMAKSKADECAKNGEAFSFRVVYVCSNQNIARKNIRKLNIFGLDNVNDISNNRLSMQHLKLAQQENAAGVKLIPITPQTSFRMTSSKGNRDERALMYAVLRNFFNGYEGSLSDFLKCGVGDDSWGFACCKYCEEVDKISVWYEGNVIEKIRNSYSQLLSELENRIASKGNCENDNALIMKLRSMFAQISVELLKPDLVIMDEFQRFRFLLSGEDEEDDTNEHSSAIDNEMAIIAKKFLGDCTANVLLLSATPYKLYSTIEEIEASPENDHYKEFMQVMDFLYNNEEEQKKFKKAWSDYSKLLENVSNATLSELMESKKTAKGLLSAVMCRNERLSVMNGEDFIDDSSKDKPLELNELDVKSYIEASSFVKSCIGENASVPVDYVKSSPFLMSFLAGYGLLDKIQRGFKSAKVGKRNVLWVKRGKIYDYKELPKSNARLEMLKDVLFKTNNSHLFLWIPPSLPYYEMEGVYKGSEGFSKVLIFSSWGMVPRMIGSLISYEAERLTIGTLDGRKNYFSKNYYHSDRLRDGNEWYLLYPSKWLANLYNPIECFKDNKSLADIQRGLQEEISKKIAGFGDYVTHSRHDDRWYLLAPMLADGACYVNGWLDGLRNGGNAPDSPGKDTIAVGRMMNSLLEGNVNIYNEEGIMSLNMGDFPSDLAAVLAEMAIGSPAVSVYRRYAQAGYDNPSDATELARVFVRNFNSKESTAVIDLSCKNDDSSYWKKVLRYCNDGNFQAMFDEYYHMVEEDACFGSSDMAARVHNTMLSALSLHTASYSIETDGSFLKGCGNAANAKGADDDKNAADGKMKIRAHYAVGFVNPGKSETEQNMMRKENIQDAFNSPLRPFVLASTSIGQEGLDFHYYCRKIMHWNLPGNPVDFEQREGRVNRYKCLAIRQSLAQKYSGSYKFDTKKDVWKSIFDKAIKDFRSDSDLVPYWCLGKEQTVKVERILPLYPLSIDQIKYERLVKILSLYRMTMGQGRQEELLQHVFKNFDDIGPLKKLFIDLTPAKIDKNERDEILQNILETV